MTFKIKADPTFTSTVKIPQHGGGEADLVIVFKHKTSKQLDAYFEKNQSEGREPSDALSEIVESWEADVPFSKKAAQELLENYQGAFAAILTEYVSTLKQLRLGN
jgi:uncharacterized protein YicC (UPF0701 family)